MLKGVPIFNGHGDSDVDQAELSVFLGCLSGSGVPANPDCAP